MRKKQGPVVQILSAVVLIFLAVVLIVTAVAPY